MHLFENLKSYEDAEIRNNIAETSVSVTTTIRINQKKKKTQNLIIYFKIKLHNKIEKKKKRTNFFKQSMRLDINYYIEH